MKQFLRQPSFLQTFKQFFSSGKGNTVSAKFLDDQIKCLHLFHCFKEAGDEEIYQSISNAKGFDNNVINLSYTSLSPYDIECVALFLSCSPHKEWKKLNLFKCNIQDIGLRILHRDLTSCDVTIRVLDLRFNGFTKSSFVGDLTIHCKVEELWISGNLTIGEDPALYNVLSLPSSRLVGLDISNTSLSSTSTIILFTALAKRNKLQFLGISGNLITDEACDFIATTMTDTSIVTLWMTYNKISAEAAEQLVQAIKKNNTLEELWLSHYTEDIKKRIRSLQAEVEENRENRGCHTKLKTYFV